jgi:hypothetical protein
LSPEWLVECLKHKRLSEEMGFEVEVEIPKKLSTATSKLDEEEKKDKVVKLEDIMEDVYAVKFGKANKKRTYVDLEGDHESSTFKRAATEASKPSQSHLTYRSKSYKDGEEILSEDSYLFQWKPDYIARNEEFWDSKAGNFACAKGSSGLAYKNMGKKIEGKDDVVMTEAPVDGADSKEEENKGAPTKQKPMNEEVVK